jgi:hypothetical protein
MRWPIGVYKVARPTGSRLFRPGDWALGTRYYRTLVPDATAVVWLRSHICIARVDRVEAGRLWLDDKALRHIDTDVLGRYPATRSRRSSSHAIDPEPSDSKGEGVPLLRRAPSDCAVRRRLTEWANAGVFDQLHLAVLDRLGEQGRLEWERAAVDTMSVRAKRGGTTWPQIRSIVASLEASSTWSATAAGCR